MYNYICHSGALSTYMYTVQNQGYIIILSNIHKI